MIRNQISVTFALLLSMSGCVSDAPTNDGAEPGEGPDLGLTDFFSSSSNLLVQVRENTTKVIELELTNETGGYAFLGAKALSATDVVVGLAVDIPLRDEIEYHPYSIPGDNRTWATRAFGSVAGEDPELAKAILFLSAGEAEATFEIGVVDPSNYGLQWWAHETMNGRETVATEGVEFEERLKSGTSWFIQDQLGIQSWDAGGIETGLDLGPTGFDFSWNALMPGSLALETLFHIGAGAAMIESTFNGETKTSAFVYLQTQAGAVPAILSNFVPGFDSGSSQMQCIECSSPEVAGQMSFTGDSSPTADSVSLRIVSVGQIPTFGWQEHGWPSPAA